MALEALANEAAEPAHQIVLTNSKSINGTPIADEAASERYVVLPTYDFHSDAVFC
jgi:hypothetical protein